MGCEGCVGLERCKGVGVSKGLADGEVGVMVFLKKGMVWGVSKGGWEMGCEGRVVLEGGRDNGGG